ncbi:hypothetical protein [Aliikangiella coralliicola]|uniref:Uncharacterized protein n=1 Tax=Aliikangiella coralliicola TaxID=2592383 RepID=A0A545U8L9_9GAMM|nr:hypothetical protein [Aliikangiella coralliicola]TQV85808.1 hypothetical protein FLL46_17945 [Aliikangiella coralliicola]
MKFKKYLVLILGVLSLTGAIQSSADEDNINAPMQIFETRSDSIGNITSYSSRISVNDVTGTVKANLPTVGPAAFGLQPVYVTNNRVAELPNEENTESGTTGLIGSKELSGRGTVEIPGNFNGNTRYISLPEGHGSIDDPKRANVGESWWMDYGRLIVQRGILDWSVIPRPGGAVKWSMWSEVALYENGSKTQFSRDLTFMNYPQPQPGDQERINDYGDICSRGALVPNCRPAQLDAHFIDGDFRRITTDSDKAFTKAYYYLSKPNGEIITYAPRVKKTIPSEKPNAEEFDAEAYQNYFAEFYPIEIQRANGQKIFIHYQGETTQEGITYTTTNKIDYVQDQFGRKLKFEYEGQSQYVKYVRLLHGTKSQLLVTFNRSDGQVKQLEDAEYPDTKYTISYVRHGHIDFIETIESDDFERVDVTYKRYAVDRADQNSNVCSGPPNDQSWCDTIFIFKDIYIRAAVVSTQGIDYQYCYFQYGDRNNNGQLDDDEHIRADDRGWDNEIVDWAPFYTMTVSNGTCEDNVLPIEQEGFNENTHAVASAYFIETNLHPRRSMSDMLQGLITSRWELYKGKEKWETWKYRPYIGDWKKRGMAGGNAANGTIFAKAKLQQYRQQIADNTWRQVVTTDPFINVDIWKQPWRIESYLCQKTLGEDTNLFFDSCDKKSRNQLVQYIHEHRNADTLYPSMGDEFDSSIPYVTNLRTKREVFADVNVDQINSGKQVGRLEATYHDLYPIPVSTTRYHTPNDSYTTTYQYHGLDTGCTDTTHFGFLCSETKNGGDKTEFGNYQFGQAGQVKQNDIVLKTAEYNFLGQVTKETSNQVTTAYEYYPENLRLKFKINPYGVFELYEYEDGSCPDDSSGVFSFNRVTNSSTGKVTTSCFDQFKRPVRTHDIVDNSDGQNLAGDVSETEYDPVLGISLTSHDLTSPLGKTTTTKEIDVYGRTTNQTTSFYSESSQTVPETINVSFTYEYDDFELTTTERTQYLDKFVEKISVTDEFGRVLKAGLDGSGSDAVQYTLLGYSRQNALQVTEVNANGNIRTMKHDWMNRLLEETHPELKNIPVKNEYNEKGLLEKTTTPTEVYYYSYNGRNLLEQVEYARPNDPDNKIIIKRFDYDLNRGVLLKTRNGEGLTAEQPSATANPDSSEVSVSFLSFNSLNQPTHILVDIPDLLAPPTGLEVEGFLGRDTESLEVNWSGNNDSYVVEFSKADLPPLVWETSAASLTINASSFTQQLNSQYSHPQAPQEIKDVYNAYQADISGSKFLADNGGYKVRVYGMKGYEPSVPTEYFQLGSGLDDLTLGRAEFDLTSPVEESESDTSTLTYSAEATDNIEVELPVFSGPFEAKFVDTPANKMTLIPGQSVNFSITFHAPAEITSFEEESFFKINGGAYTLPLKVKGTSTEAGLPIISVSGDLDFGTLQYGESRAVEISVRNAGDDALSGNVIVRSLDTENPDTSAITLSTQRFSGLKGDDTQPITVTYSAGPDVNQQLELRFVADNSSVASVTRPIQVNVIPNLNSGTMHVRDTQVDFGQIYEGHKGTERVRVRNSETHSTLYRFDVTLVSHPNDEYAGDQQYFRLQSPPGEQCPPLNYNWQCSVKFEFNAPSTKRVYKALAIFTHGDNPPVQVELTAESVAMAKAVVTDTYGQIPELLNFGLVPTMTTPREIDLKIKNIGSFKLAYRVSSYSYSDDGHNPFKFNPAMGQWWLLNPGDESDIKALFDPDGMYPGTYHGGFKIEECAAGTSNPNNIVTDCEEYRQEIKLPAYGLLNIGTVVEWEDTQPTVFPAGAPGQKVRLPLKLKNLNYPDRADAFPLVVYGKGAFAGRVSTSGGFGCSSYYCLPPSGSYAEDRLYFKVPAIGQQSGEICVAIQTMDEPMTEECQEFTATGVRPVKIATQYYPNETYEVKVNPLRQTSGALQMDNWGVCRPVKIEKPQGSVDIYASVDAPFFLSKFRRHDWEEFPKLPLESRLEVNAGPFTEFHICAGPQASIGDETRITFELDYPESASDSFPEDTTVVSQVRYFVPQNDEVEIELAAPSELNFAAAQFGSVRYQEFEVRNLSTVSTNLKFDRRLTESDGLGRQMVYGPFRITALANGKEVPVEQFGLGPAGAAGGFDRIRLRAYYEPKLTSDAEQIRMTFLRVDNNQPVDSLLLKGSATGYANIYDSAITLSENNQVLTEIDFGSFESSEIRSFNFQIKNNSHHQFNLDVRYVSSSGSANGAIGTSGASFAYYVGVAVNSPGGYLSKYGMATLPVTVIADGKGNFNGSLQILAGGQLVKSYPVKGSVGQSKPFTVYYRGERKFSGVAGVDNFSPQTVEIITNSRSSSKGFSRGRSSSSSSVRFKHLNQTKALHPIGPIEAFPTTSGDGYRFTYNASSNYWLHTYYRPMIEDTLTGKRYSLSNIYYQIDAKPSDELTVLNLEKGWMDFRYTEYYKPPHSASDLNYTPEWTIVLRNNTNQAQTYSLEFQAVVDYSDFALIENNGAFIVSQNSVIVAPGQSREVTIRNHPQDYGDTLSILSIKEGGRVLKTIPVRSMPLPNSLCYDPDHPLYESLEHCDWPLAH